MLALAQQAHATPGTVGVNDGSLVFRAAPGAANVLRITRFHEVTDHGAPLIAKPGCVAGLPIQCDFFAYPVVHVGDRDDVAWISSDNIRITVRGGTGNDEIAASSADITYVYDTLKAGGQCCAYVDGGDGHDRLAGCYLLNEDELRGESDRIVYDGNSIAQRLDGGDGRDVILGPAVLAVGGTDNDVIVNRSRFGTTVNAGDE